MSRRLSLLLVVALSLLLARPGPLHAQEGRPHVVASFSILADVARNVAGDAADVTALMPLGADPHSFTPAPRDLVALADADAIFVVGAGFEEGLLDAIAGAVEPSRLVVASSCVQILPFGGASQAHEAEDEAHAHEEDEASPPAPETGGIAGQCAAHHAELSPYRLDPAPASVEPLGMLYALSCGGAEEADHAEDAHQPGSCDPHVWTDPYNVMLWALMVRDTLADLDPAHADAYAANADAYVESLARLLEEELLPLVESLPPQDRLLVTNHGAFGYFARAFGFAVNRSVIPAASTLAEPGAADIAALVQAIRAQGIPAIFAETTANPDLARQIAADTGVRFYTLYTGTLSDADGPAATYLDYMRYNTRTIVEALSQ